MLAICIALHYSLKPPLRSSCKSRADSNANTRVAVQTYHFCTCRSSTHSRVISRAIVDYQHTEPSTSDLPNDIGNRILLVIGGDHDEHIRNGVRKHRHIVSWLLLNAR